MFKKAFVISLFAINSAYASDIRDLQCGYLHIFINNQSGHTCFLNYQRVDNGQLANGSMIPDSIKNGEKTQAIVMQQGYTRGPNLRLEYDCEDNLVVMTSQQNLCWLTAGNITGDTINTNEVYASYESKMGSWWNATPGEITWTLKK